jgi:hypothetical protein
LLLAVMRPFHFFNTVRSIDKLSGVSLVGDAAVALMAASSMGLAGARLQRRPAVAWAVIEQKHAWQASVSLSGCSDQPAVVACPCPAAVLAGRRHKAHALPWLPTVGEVASRRPAS